MIAQITLQDGALFFTIGLFALCLFAYLYLAVRERTLAWRLSSHALFHCKKCGLVIMSGRCRRSPGNALVAVVGPCPIGVYQPQILTAEKRTAALPAACTNHVEPQLYYAHHQRPCGRHPPIRSDGTRPPPH